MNIPTVWEEQKLGDGSVRYISEHAARGPIVVTATKVAAAGGEKIVWDDEDNVPVFLHERANRALGISA